MFKNNNLETYRQIKHHFSEIKELRDEGIDTEVIPWIEDKSN